MYKITSELKDKFKEYVKAAIYSANDLEFLLENLGINVNIDYSEESLIKLEKIYWDFKNKGDFPSELGNIEDFASLLGRYLGQSIIHYTGANWIQSKEKNRMFGQPCIDGFGNKKWEKIYPVALSIHLPELSKTNPTIPGVKDKKVFAEQLKKAIKIYKKNKGESNSL